MISINTNEVKYKNFLDQLKKKYGQTVTEISKTSADSTFIEDDTIMISGDDLNNNYKELSYASVDGIDYKVIDDRLHVYFFEFKKIDLYDKNFFPKDKLNNYLNEMEKDPKNEKHVKMIRNIKKGLSDKKISSLKIKPLETLITLQNLYDGPMETLTSIKKHYYFVSKTPLGNFFKNKNNYVVGKKYNNLFEFKYKLQPYPFFKAEPMNEGKFLDFIH